MYHYLFTNDLRISNLSDSLVKAGKCFSTNTVPSANKNKSENNFMNTLGFYFNLTKDSNCAKLCADGNTRIVVLNFIKKFQFPNPRTAKSMTDSVNDNITLAPMRLIMQMLYNMRMLCPDEAKLSVKEIADFIFYNSDVAKTKTPDIHKVITHVIEYRKNGIMPNSIETNPDERVWKHEERQIKHMIEILSFSGCIKVNGENEIFIDHDNLSVDEKSMIFDIITFSDFWVPPVGANANAAKEGYQSYMDINENEIKKSEEQTTSGIEDNTDIQLPDEAECQDELIEPYSKEQFLQDVFMDEDEYETLKQILTYKRNIILQGSPGVGKTYLAKRFAYSLMNKTDSSRVKLVQFHQNYSYEDFIMGYKPDGEGFKLIDGVFFEFCQKAERDGRDYYFIIDEINRGNVSKIFGELMMLIENDKRGIEKLRLAYKDVLFTVPKNVYIIGMMNTADRSLAIMDYALRRRFSFYEVEPAFGKDNFKNHLKANGITESMIKKINDNFVALNAYIADEKNSGLGSGFRIGHSYFCTKPNCEEDKWYENIIKFEIQPMLEEYWFDEKDKVCEWMGKIK